MLPELSLFNVGKTEFPVLIRLINAFEEALSLFFFRKVEEKLDDSRSVTVEMLFQVHDGTIPFLPDSFLVKQLVRQPLAAQNLRMHPNDQHFLVIGTVEDADAAAFRQTLGGAPQKIVLQFRSTGMFETEHLAALGIDAGHHVPDGAVLAGGVHRLKNQQHRIAVGRVVKMLQRAQLLHLFFEEFVDTASSTCKRASQASATF